MRRLEIGINDISVQGEHEFHNISYSIKIRLKLKFDA